MTRHDPSDEKKRLETESRLAMLFEARTPKIDPLRLSAEADATWRRIQQLPPSDAVARSDSLLTRLFAWRPVWALGALVLLLGVLAVFGSLDEMDSQGDSDPNGAQVAQQDAEEEERAADRLVGGIDSLDTAQLASMTAQLESILKAESLSEADWRENLSDFSTDDSSDWWNL
jgi:hypothetical protein